MSSWFLKRQGICDNRDKYQYFCLIRKKLFSSTSALSIVILLPISLIIIFCLKACQMTRSNIFYRNKHFHLSFLYIIIIPSFFCKNNAGDRLEVALTCLIQSKISFNDFHICMLFNIKKRMKEFTSIKNHYLLNTVEL